MSLKEQLRRLESTNPHEQLRTSDSLYFGETPDTLSKVGLDRISLAFTVRDYRKSRKNKHNVPRRSIKALRASLEDSFLVFKKDDRYGFVTSDIDADGKPVLIAIQRDVDMDRAKVNAIRSVYGIGDPAHWILNQEKEGRVPVILKEKEAQSFLQTYGYIASVGENNELHIDSIEDHDQNVKEKHSDRDPDFVRQNKSLAKQNEKLQEDVSYLREMLKLQKQTTDGKLFTRSSVESAARYLKKQGGVRGDTQELAGEWSSSKHSLTCGTRAA